MSMVWMIVLGWAAAATLILILWNIGFALGERAVRLQSSGMQQPTITIRRVIIPGAVRQRSRARRHATA
jgi:hypothetical protein